MKLLPPSFHRFFCDSTFFLYSKYEIFLVLFWIHIKSYVTYGVIIIRVFWPRAGLLLQTQAPGLQFCPKAGLPLQTQVPRLEFY